MKKYIPIILLVFCSFIFTKCNDDLGLSNDGVKLTVTVSACPILKDGDADEDPQPMYAISGYVTDGDGNPLDATVDLLEAPVNSLFDSTVTNNQGAYNFNNVPGGSYNIEATVDGVVVDSESITL